MTLNTGLTPDQAMKSANALGKILADTFILYVKTLNFHWNVVGPYFPQLHKLFEEQYEAQAENLDRIAERMRALGATAPATLTQFQKLTGLSETSEAFQDAEMVRVLMEDNETAATHIREACKKIDDADGATRNMLEEILEEHEKFAWMLRSILEK
jgi:starvation-inducible DNA-binding protein